MSIRSTVSPCNAIVPLPPLPATSSMSRDIGLPALTIEPVTCALTAPAAATLAACTIWAGVLEAKPLPDVPDEPHPVSSTAAIAATNDADARAWIETRIAPQSRERSRRPLQRVLQC